MVYKLEGEGQADETPSTIPPNDETVKAPEEESTDESVEGEATTPGESAA